MKSSAGITQRVSQARDPIRTGRALMLLGSSRLKEFVAMRPDQANRTFQWSPSTYLYDIHHSFDHPIKVDVSLDRHSSSTTGPAVEVVDGRRRPKKLGRRPCLERNRNEARRL